MLKNEPSKIESLLYSYIKEACHGSQTKIEIIKKALLHILNDFFDNKKETESNLHLLEAFAGDMLYAVNTPDEIKESDSKLAYILDVASDITFPFQEGSKRNDLSEYNKLVEELKNYLISETENK